jgi:hypothetical protein
MRRFAKENAQLTGDQLSEALKPQAKSFSDRGGQSLSRSGGGAPSDGAGRRR